MHEIKQRHFQKTGHEWQMGGIYIYIYAVKLKSGPRFGVLMLKSGPSLKLKSGPSFFHCFPHFYSVFWGIFRNTNSATVCQNSVFAKFGGCQKWGFERKLHFLFFPFLCWKNRNRKKKRMKMEKNPKKTINIGFFLRWSSKNVKKTKKMDF